MELMKTAIFKLSILLISLLTYNSFSQSANLSNQEVTDMKYMLEEEKLARDVYEYFDDIYNLRIFNNIKISEQRHMDMIEYLLNSYKISYTLSSERGIFYNKQLQTTYNQLIKQGIQSQHHALEAGKMIEVQDIDDLEKASKKTSHSDISSVYSKLIMASNNHLQAFNRNLSRI